MMVEVDLHILSCLIRFLRLPSFKGRLAGFVLPRSHVLYFVKLDEKSQPFQRGRTPCARRHGSSLETSDQMA